MSGFNYFADNNLKVCDSDKHTEETPEVRQLIADMPTPKFYDIHEGFLKIANPGWIIFDFGEEKEITYFRFLLWDNCGSEKKQPSRRKYIYRVLIAGEIPESEKEGKYRWEVVHDTMYNGSNGWQEFYFESAVRRIRYIKLYFMCNSRNSFTHLVDIQAYRYPTETLYNYIAEFSIPTETYIPEGDFAPPIHGLINNRILISDKKELECIISAQIFEYVTKKLHAIYKTETTEKKELKSIIREVDQRTEELYSIDKELQLFQSAIHAPIIRKFQVQKRINRRLSWISICLTLLGIAMLICDIVKNWNNP